MGKGGGATKGAVGEGRIKGGGKKEKKERSQSPLDSLRSELRQYSDLFSLWAPSPGFINKISLGLSPNNSS